MKNIIFKIITFTILAIIITTNIVFAAFIPINKENLITAFSNIETETDSKIKFDVFDSTIKLTANVQQYEFQYDLSKKTFSKEIEKNNNLTTEEINTVKSQILALVYAYIAVSNAQGISIENSKDYIVEHLYKINEAVKLSLQQENSDKIIENEVSKDVDLEDIINSNFLNNVIYAMSTHNDGDATYSDNHTFSLQFVVENENKAKILLVILPEDFTPVDMPTTSWSYGLINKNNNETTENIIQEDTTISQQNTTKEDNTISQEEIIPQTGRSYLGNNVLIATIIIVVAIIIGMILNDFKNNKQD